VNAMEKKSGLKISKNVNISDYVVKEIICNLNNQQEKVSQWKNGFNLLKDLVKLKVL
jgi:hypothetical protein